jgi:hypothetical protein
LWSYSETGYHSIDAHEAVASERAVVREEIAALVTKRRRQYFSVGNIAMGDSTRAHVN